MKISTKGRYALRVMIDLAINPNEYVSIKELSLRQGITIKYLEQIVSLLNKAGYLDVLRGNKGGYKLKYKPKEYIVGNILRVTEGNLDPIECLINDNICSRKNICKTFSFWKGLDEVINNYVDSKTLEDLIR